MAALAALSIDLEGTAVGLRPPSQATYQALPRHAGSLGRLYPKVNHMGVDGCVRARAFGEQPSPDVDGSVAASGKIEGLNETRGHQQMSGGRSRRVPRSVMTWSDPMAVWGVRSLSPT